MSQSKRRRPSGAMVVAVIALIVAMTGSAFAGPLETLINGSSIKKHSIPGNRLINHTLTGQQINLSKLGAVPHAGTAASAAHATTAANAVKLGGCRPPATCPLPRCCAGASR